MIIVWHGNDLRTEDNPALFHACHEGTEVLPLYIYSQNEEGTWPPGSATKWWLHHSLASLSGEYRKLGGSLALRKGSSLEVLKEIIKKTGATAIYRNRHYEPDLRIRDLDVEQHLRKNGIEVKIFDGNTLFPPSSLLNKEGKPYGVFTPFWKNLYQNHQQVIPSPSPLKVKTPEFRSDSLDSLKLLPTIGWDQGIKAFWKPGRKGALERIHTFTKEALKDYVEGRDIMAVEGTSMLSPHLHFGEVGVKEVWRIAAAAEETSIPFLRQLAWREFAYHLLFFFKETPLSPWKKEWSSFPWKEHAKHLKAWQRGMTGYPIVDAGMRQLWQTGWMHNRVRMIVGSFLVKDLLISWVDGAKWFWDTLVDADLANNTMGWQWIAGCGADAAPYFRVFNPVLQGKKFDPEGIYIKRYVPELSTLPKDWIHNPWEAPPLLLRQAGISMGKDYPYPLVDHKEAREKALAAWGTLKDYK